MTRALHGVSFTAKRKAQQQTALSLKQQCVLGMCVALLLFSAFSVVYLKDLSRRLFMQYQNAQQVQQQNDMEWSKLLLEEGTWSTQARIQRLAKSQLQMVTPTSKQIVIITE